MNPDSNIIIRYIVISIIAGILFGFMDALIHANPLAEKFLEVYKPISRKSVNITAGI
jgi:ethanolamine ammonia-lyase large subunit